MKVATISPVPYLNEFATLSDTHMVLAHIYLLNDTYRKFYLDRKEKGDTIILDNGAFELGESLPLKKLTPILKELNPQHFILPDKRFDATKTLNLVEKAIEKVSKISSANLIGVPQGSDLTEIMFCYNTMMKMPAISGFGIYEEIGEVSGLGRRVDFCNYLQLNNPDIKEKYYHMLGMEENLGDTVQLANFDWVSSVDSAKPIVYGIYNMSIANYKNFLKYPHRPSDYFSIDGLSNQIANLCKANIKYLQDWIGDIKCAQLEEH
jgi:hypothetical protein